MAIFQFHYKRFKETKPMYIELSINETFKRLSHDGDTGYRMYIVNIELSPYFCWLSNLSHRRIVPLYRSSHSRSNPHKWTQNNGR